MMRTLTAFLLLGTLILAAAWPETASAGPATPEMARNLAENVLGHGTVQSVRIKARSLLIAWESATYRPENDLMQTRELLHAEAELATGSMMGRLRQINTIHFVITGGGRRLANGVNARGAGITLTFAAHLGGGQYVPRQTVPTPGNGKKRPGRQI